VTAASPGDLLFFATAGSVHHVAIYAGADRMVHAPGTGFGIETIPISTPSYAAELVGVRRYLG
jgi:cell wall-associated NlpC family hydrolase